MKLYIDTSNNKKLVIKLLKADKIVAESEQEVEFGSQKLLTMIQQILQDQGWDFKDLTEIELFPGPGSYTGLRVGAAVAQALGFGLNIPVNGKLNKPVDLRYQ